MTPVVWMTGVSVGSWLAVLAVWGDSAHPEALFGMLGPLASACVTWVAVQRTYRSAPERLTGVMTIGFAVKFVFFGVYVAVMLKLLSLRPVPFVFAFASYFIALYAMQALFLRRLTFGSAD